MIGQTISHYRITEKLGAGGMGVVYKAEDTNLDRTVALKFLAAHLLDSDEHKQRFLREAKAAASLDHPNICMVHEVGEAGGHVFLALGYIDGPEVSAKIRERPLRLEEALDIAVQAAEGLRAAHQKGIVHRDIKSSNLMLTSTGQVKIMDFGLAQLAAETRITRTDTVLGTPAYMSPEQAQRQTTDKRSDIWSLGVVLYEMVTGRLPFHGEREAAVVHSIIHDRHEPVTALRAGVPLELDRILAKALAKKPSERYQHVDDLLVDLRALARDASSTVPSAGKRWVAALAAAGLSLALAVAALLYMRPRSSPPPARVEYTRLTNFADSATSPALSRDGRMLAFIRGESTFIGPGQIYVKLLPSGEPVQLTTDNLHKMSPKFSPGGDRIAYTTWDRKGGWNTWVVPVLGGKPTLFLKNAEGLTWIGGTDAPRLMFSEMTGWGQQMGIMTSLESRAQQRTVFMPPEESGMAHRSYLSPDGNHVLLILMRVSRWAPCGLARFEGGGSQETPVGPSPAQCTDAAWSPDGQWMYFSANTGSGSHIWRQRFPDGVPEQITSGATEEDGIEFAADGRSFVTSVGTSTSTLWVHDSRGDRQITSEGFAIFPSFSPDGKKLYYLQRGGGSRSIFSGELWAADLQSGQRERLLPDFLMKHYTVSADGKRVVFAEAVDEGKSPVWLAVLDRSTPPRKVSARNARKAYFGDGGEILFLGDENGANILTAVKEDGSDQPRIVPRPQFRGKPTNLDDYGLNVSPDGKWVVSRGTNDVPGATMVYAVAGGSPILLCEDCAQVLPFERGPPPPFVSWPPDGRFLYLNFHGSIYAIPLRQGEVLPRMPAKGIRTIQELMALPGVRLVGEGAYPGPNPSLYAFTKFAIQRNIYRIPAP
jgi:Tol biopolymer transport system component/tRNA A-37 threonylcarbamoyl transferase component Bud32